MGCTSSKNEKVKANRYAVESEPADKTESSSRNVSSRGYLDLADAKKDVAKFPTTKANVAPTDSNPDSIEELFKKYKDTSTQQKTSHVVFASAPALPGSIDAEMTPEYAEQLVQEELEALTRPVMTSQVGRLTIKTNPTKNARIFVHQNEESMVPFTPAASHTQTSTMMMSASDSSPIADADGDVLTIVHDEHDDDEFDQFTLVAAEVETTPHTHHPFQPEE